VKFLPGFWTHIIFGKDVLQEVGLDPDSERKGEFNLGCIFTDVGKYCEKNSPEYLLWKLSHTNGCDTFGEVLCRRLEGVSRFYVMGVFCHFFLDLSVNQYIMARAGTGYRSGQLEIMIDRTILKERLTVDILKLKPLAELPLSIDEELEQVFQRTASEVYNLDFTSISRAVDTMKDIFCDYYGRSRFFLLLKGLFLKSESAEIAFFRDTHDDPVNAQMSPWFHSIAGWESRLTFKDLYGKAVSDAVRFLHRYLDGDKDWSLPAMSLMTGLPLMEQEENKNVEGRETTAQR
jgi:hypothetical protein